ncbi:hypothetical protein HDU67_006626 [Dinochytrium kinnereticum]|nr:hypothetical protein HDU67_006626 [Dinochytrium kinnereticum]
MSEYLTDAFTIAGSSSTIKLSIKSYSIKQASIIQHNALVVLMAHANGLCKELWEPTIRHLLSSLSKDHTNRTPFIYTWDARNHGDSARLNDPEMKFVNWWDAGRDALAVTRWVKERHGRSSTYIGVGHSFGGCQMIMTEILEPKSFERLLVFEPIVMNSETLRFLFGTDVIADIDPNHVKIARAALKRKATFKTRDEAIGFFKSKPFFQAWTDESLSLYVKHGLRELIPPEVTLKCTPMSESAVFLTGSPPDVYEGLKKICIPLSVIMGERSDHAAMPFRVEGKLVVRDLHLPTVAPKGSSIIMKNVGHMCIVEDPGATAIVILKAARENIRSTSRL